MWFNPIMKGLLRSPLHFFVSRSMALLTYRGRKSGRTYSTPVSYLSVGDVLYTVSSRDRVWWRNMRGGAQVKLRLVGNDVAAQGLAIEDAKQVERELLAYLGAAPERARYLGVQLGEDGAPIAEDLKRVAAEKVVVKWQLAGEAVETPRNTIALQNLAGTRKGG